jgi:hypothetical protein
MTQKLPVQLEITSSIGSRGRTGSDVDVAQAELIEWEQLEREGILPPPGFTLAEALKLNHKQQIVVEIVREQPPKELVCKVCGRTLPLDQFTKQPACRWGHATTCKRCYSQQVVRRRSEARESNREVEGVDQAEGKERH